MVVLGICPSDRGHGLGKHRWLFLTSASITALPNICYLAVLMYFYGRRPLTTVDLSLFPKTILIRLQKKRTYSLCLQPMTLTLFYSLLCHTAE